MLAKEIEFPPDLNNLTEFFCLSHMMSSITDTVCKDHRDLANYYRKILTATDDDTASRWQNQFIWALARHLIAEELVVDPAFEKVLGERGIIIADKNRSEHQRVSL
jgi:hemerythrin superfamily protein